MGLLPDLSIVIVSFQVRDHLKRCLNSLYALKESPQFEVFVVDNASTDGSIDGLQNQFPAVHLISNTENRGFAAANNQGLEASKARYVMLLNPDTEIPAKEPDALGILISFMDSHSAAGACGPRLTYGDGSFQHSAFGFPTLAQVLLDFFPLNWRLTASRLNGRYPSRLYMGQAPFRVDHPLGAAFLVRREAAEQVGWLDPHYFMYVEEIDWARRIKNAGWQTWCVPTAEVIHYEAQSTLQFRDKMFVELWRSRFRYFQKYESPTFNRVMRLIVRAGLARLGAKALAAESKGEITRAELKKRQDAYAQVRLLAAATGPVQTIPQEKSQA